MAERPDQIEQHIQSTRHQLGNNLHQLENKVRQAADWKTYYDRNPMMMVGLAFGGGVLLASLTGGRREAAPFAERVPRNAGYLTGTTQGSPVSETWRNMKTALIALSGAKIRTLLDEVIPGFGEHYDNAARGNASYPGSSQHPETREYEVSSHRM